MDKKFLRKYGIKIQSLSNNTHLFEFEFDQKLLDQFNSEIDISDSKGTCNIILLKTDMMLNVTFKIKGETNLICDRTLKTFTHFLNFSKKILFKFGEEDEEISDEMIVINRGKSILNISKFIYEFFILEIPVKRLHPSIKNEDNIDNFVYKTSTTKKIDPRLASLKKLK
jgi:uncharacterized metal-binding protein YceD (DUF177 family)|tara:strand:- start:459 stop:965 length:507 start_codon:yes stop_codon:yes gene_type:complete